MTQRNGEKLERVPARNRRCIFRRPVLRRHAALTLLLAVVTCRVQQEDLYERIFVCDPTAIGDPCGPTRDGRPMTCYVGSQLGGDDFCVEACDPKTSAGGQTNDSRFTCTPSGGRLRRCRPRALATDLDGSCPSGLQCYRTDLLQDQGVCLKMKVCSDNADCDGSSVRPVCASSIIKKTSALPLNTDGLQCIKATCKSSGSSCQPGESCLASYYDLATELSDICVPNCVGNAHCPPNFSCAATAAAMATGSPAICLPGLPGIRCTHNQDCVVGDCVDTGAGFSECSPTFPPCTSHADCGYLSGPGNTFFCMEGVPGAGRHCISATPFHGLNCMFSSECPSGQNCYRYSPHVVDQGKGECRVPCDQDLRCPTRGGLPHVCLDHGGGGCYPGEFGMPCAGTSQCAGDMTCLPVAPDDRTLVDSPNICTTTCATDTDCRKNPQIRTGGFCEDGVCRLAGQKGTRCNRNEQCIYSICVSSSLSAGQCGD